MQVTPSLARSVLLPFSFLLFTTCCYLYVYQLADSSSASNNNSISMTSTKQQRSADIAIVGGGLAGLAASLEASNRNPALRILLLEKEPKLGGNSAKASSGINAALNTQDAPVFADDTLKSGGGLSREQLVRVFVDQSPDAITFLEKSGVDLSVLCQLGGHSAKRTHRNANGPNVGFAIVSALQKKLMNSDDSNYQKIQVLTGVSVDKVRYEDGKVTGLQVTNQSSSESDGTPETIDAHVVILATGGFSANHELLKKFAPGMEQFPTTNGPWAKGDGLTLAQGVGAELVLMDKVQLHPTAFINPKDRNAVQKFLAPEAIRGSGALLFNAIGKRFVNELSTRDRVSQAILAQPGKSAFLLLFEGAKPLESSLGFYKHIGLVKPVHSVAEAAEYCQFQDPQTLLQELNAYADSAAGQQPDAFGKTVFPFPLQRIEDTQTPVEIHVMEVAPAVHYTMGGVKINENAQVLRADNSVIDGLYAAGEVSGGLHGSNRLGGNSLAECVVFGRIAAQQAVHQLEEQQQQQRMNDL